jgi:hypothetical protein
MVDGENLQKVKFFQTNLFKECTMFVLHYNLKCVLSDKTSFVNLHWSIKTDELTKGVFFEINR